jgi:hypothetical protein
MSNSITSLIAGEINTNEDKTSIQINCEPDSVQNNGSEIFNRVKYEVKIPFNSGNSLPISGGSIVKIDPENSTYFLNKNDEYIARVESLNRIINNELKDISNDNFIFSEYKDLSKVKLSINKCLYECAKFLKSSKNFYDTSYVPEFILSSIKSSLNINSLSSDLNEKASKKLKDENLISFGYLQYIPFENIINIYSLISKTKNQDSQLKGVGTFTGNLGISFENIYKKLKNLEDSPENFTDIEKENIISCAILEIFPIYRIEEDIIESGIDGDPKNQLSGFYTFFGSKFYIKMPDLSGRDFNENISTFNYDTEDGTPILLYYILEIFAGNKDIREYKNIVFNYSQFPSLTIQDSSISYPSTSGGQEESLLSWNGEISQFLSLKQNFLINFNNLRDFKFYLSPVIKNKSKKIKGISGLSSDKIEISTIPIDLTFKDKIPNIDKFSTVPLYYNSISSLDSILSALNRPELIISDKNNSKRLLTNERLFYSTEQQNVRTLVCGNSPRYIYDLKKIDNSKDIDYAFTPIVPSDISLHVPKHWMPLEIDDGGTSGDTLSLKLSELAKNNLKNYFPITGVSSGTDGIFPISSNNDLEFATYAIDSITGQFLRIPGYIKINVSESRITKITPDGYQGGSKISLNDEIRLDIEGEGLSGAYELMLDVPGNPRSIVNKNDPEVSIFSSSENKVVLIINKNWSSVLTTIGEFQVYLKTNNTINKETNKYKINISNEFQVDLKTKESVLVDFESLNCIFYPEKGFSIGVDKNTITENGPDSIPYIIGGGQVSLNLKSKNRIFSQENFDKIYAYIAFENLDVLKQTTIEENIFSISYGNKKLFTNKSLVWSYGSSPYFTRSGSDRRAKISFPGPMNLAENNFRYLIEDHNNIPKNAYLVFSNSLLSSDIEFNLQDSYPISILKIGSTDESPDYSPPFISPPNIVGTIIKSENNSSIYANFDPSQIIASTDSSSLSFLIKKSIPNDMVSEDAISRIINGKISSSKKIKGLIILFNGPDRPSKYFKNNYKFYIGLQNITRNRVGKIKHLKDGVVCAYFKNINVPLLNGFTDINIKVFDEFGQYDSSLFTKITKKINKTNILISGSGNEKTLSINNLNDRRIQTYTDGYASLRPNIFNLSLPLNVSIEKFYYQKFGYTNGSPGVLPIASSDPYIDFLSPIKIRPQNFNLIFGNIDAQSNPSSSISGSRIHNSDGQDSIIEVSSNSIKVILTKDELTAKAQRLLDEVRSKVSNIKSRNSDFSSGDEGSVGAEIAISSGNQVVNIERLSAELNELIADANSTVEQIQEKIDLINSVMKKASLLADKLSSANFSLSDAVEQITDQELLQLGAPDSIVRLNQKFTYIPENIKYNESFISEYNDYIILSNIIKIEQGHVIELKIPEIINIRDLKNNKIYNKNNFSELKFGNSQIEIEVDIRGGDRDTKIELGGYRLPTNFTRISGDIATYNVIINPQNLILVFSGNNCVNISITSSNIPRIGAERILDPLAGQNIDLFFERAKGSIDKVGKGKLDSIIKRTKMKVGPVIYDKSLAAKEFLKSICDASFHLTAEISFQLKFLKILYIPIKVIFCIIDVLCSLLHPVKLAFAVIRLFACLFDLLLLLPPIAMPILFLTLMLHILELLLCVIQKAIGLVVAVNEVITALDTAVRVRDIESIKNLELTLNEHFLTIEADFQVLEPIFQILGLILELLQLAFSFPCQIVQDEDQPTCIDPSMLAGIILSKVAPNGSLVPDAMLPLAQDYTRLSSLRTGENGNSPEVENNRVSILDVDYQTPPEDPRGSPINNVLFRISEAINNNKTIIVSDNSNYAGNILPDLKDSQTNESKTVEKGGFFSGDLNGDGFIDNIDYEKMRFSSGEFDASFVISCTKSKKKFSLGIPVFKPKNDPRFVEFQFNSEGLTSELSFVLGSRIGIFFKKKIVDELFTVDTPPALLKKSGKSITIHNSASINPDDVKLISPIDGFSEFIEFAGVDGNEYTYRSKPLVADIEIFEPSIDPVTNEAVVTSRFVTKTFGGIPSFAMVDNKFNVYFIEENGLRIEFIDIDGKKVPVIKSLFAKMINFPAAETQKTEKEERQQVRKTGAYNQKGDILKSSIIDEMLIYSAKDGNTSLNTWTNGYKNELGDAILKMQANAAYFESLNPSILEKISNFVDSNWVSIDTDTELFGSSHPILLVGDPSAGIPYVTYLNYRKLNQDLFLTNDKFTESGNDFVGVNGSTRLKNFIVSQSGGEILSSDIDFPYPEYGIYDFANGTWAENDDFQYAINIIDVLNFPQIYFVDMRQVADDISAACGTSQANELLLDMPGFTLDFGKDVVGPYLECLTTFRDFFIGQNDGFITKARESLASGKIPPIVSYDVVRKAYDDIVACTNKAVDDSCKFVINPLNTTFKLIEDSNDSDIPGYIDPSSVITEVITDGAVSTMPSITGAMEYASGIGDSVTIPAGSFATIQIIPRDSYDDEVVDSFDARQKINITIISDETKTGAKIVKIDRSQELLWSKNGSIYAARITSDTPGKVIFKGSICNITIQAVTDRGIDVNILENNSNCVPNADDNNDIELFPPGALRKVDRILTVLFVAKNDISIDDSLNGGSAVIMPQVPYTDMVN